MVDQLDEEKKHSATVRLATVDGEVEVTPAANGSNDVYSGKALQVRYEVLLALGKPASPALISLVEDTFVNIDNPLAFCKELDVPFRCILTLQLGIMQVVPESDRICLLIPKIKLMLEVTPDHLLGHTQLAVLQ